MGLKLFLKLFKLFKHHTNILVGTNILHRVPPPPLHKYHVHACDPTRSYENTAYHNIRFIATAAFIYGVSVLYFEGMRDNYFPCKNSFTQNSACSCLQMKVAGPVDMSLSLLSTFYLVLTETTR